MSWSNIHLEEYLDPKSIICTYVSNLIVSSNFKTSWMSKLVVAEQGPAGKNVKSADESIYVKKTETKQQLCVQAVWQSDKSRMKMIAAIFYDADFNEPTV